MLQKNNAERAKLLLLSEKIDGGKGQNIASGQQSDHLLLVAVYNRWMKILKQVRITNSIKWISENFLRYNFQGLCLCCFSFPQIS